MVNLARAYFVGLMLAIAGLRSNHCPGVAVNRTSGPALLAGRHRFACQTDPLNVPLL